MAENRAFFDFGKLPPLVIPAKRKPSGESELSGYPHGAERSVSLQEPLGERQEGCGTFVPLGDTLQPVLGSGPGGRWQIGKKGLEFGQSAGIGGKSRYEALAQETGEEGLEFQASSIFMAAVAIFTGPGNGAEFLEVP